VHHVTCDFDVRDYIDHDRTAREVVITAIAQTECRDWGDAMMSWYCTTDIKELHRVGTLSLVVETIRNIRRGRWSTSR